MTTTDSHKRCSKCKEWKPKSEFTRFRAESKAALKGSEFACGCKQCNAADARRRYRRDCNPNPQPRCLPSVRGEMKWCPRCKEWKPKTQFYLSKNRKCGLECFCKQCKSIIAKQKYQPNPNPKLCRHPVRGNLKRCPKCKKWMLLSQFPIQKSNKHGVHAWCRECTSKYDLRWRKENLTKMRILDRIYNDSYRYFDKPFGSLTIQEQYDLLCFRVFRLILFKKISESEGHNFMRDFASSPREVFFRVFAYKINASFMRALLTTKGI
jgi:hypothetical protein